MDSFQCEIIIVGTASTVSAAVTEGGYAIYSLKSYDDRDIYDKYDTNDEIESEADSIVDFQAKETHLELTNVRKLFLPRNY